MAGNEPEEEKEEGYIHIRTVGTDWMYKPAEFTTVAQALEAIRDIGLEFEAMADGHTIESALENCLEKTREWANGVDVMNDYENDLSYADKADRLRKAADVLAEVIDVREREMEIILHNYQGENKILKRELNMKTKLSLTFNKGLTRKDEPLVIYITEVPYDGRKEALVARIVHPEMGGIGFVKGNETNGSLLPIERLELAVKMTLAPEMWKLLFELDEILDSIKSHQKAYRIVSLLDGEGLWEQHDMIKNIRHQARKTGKFISLDYEVTEHVKRRRDSED